MTSRAQRTWEPMRMMSQRCAALLASAMLCVAACSSESDNPFGEGGELCDVAETASDTCAASGESSGYDCIGSFLGGCTGELADEWRSAWSCIQAKCENGASQSDAEAACDAEGKAIPAACGSGISDLAGGFGFSDAGAAPSP